MLRRALVFFVLSSLVAQASEPELPALTPEGKWNYITQDDATSSSRCIGTPDTPLCAVETLLACFQRDRIDLCRLVDDGTDQYSQIFSAPADPDKYLAYRVIAASRSGAAVVVSIDQREGQMGRYAKSTGAPNQDFKLERLGNGRWKIVNWGEPGE